MKKEPILIKPSQLVEKIFYINGKPFSFEGREYLRKVYDSKHTSIILKAGRQVEKSTTLAGRMLAYAFLIPHFQQLYVSPSAEQTRRFTSQKLNEFINNSPIFKEVMLGPKSVQRVFEKTFSNSSRIILSYALLSADRIRGTSADALYLDEIQDMIVENIPVIEETMSHSQHKHRIYVGTPKHLQTAIEYYWNLSTQTEWVVKCDACNHWNVLTEANISPSGLICEKCGAKLNKQNGTWADMVKDAPFKGLRLPQLIMSWITWDEIWRKYNEYPREQFYNEVLALPFSSATNILTVEDLVKASGTHPNFYKYDPVFTYNQPTYMGVDWSTSAVDTGSYTAVAIGTFLQGKFVVLHLERFVGLDADIGNAIKKIIDLAREFRVQLIGADWGVGSGGANATIRSALGHFESLWEFYYSSNQKELVKWDNKGLKFIVNRTSTLTNLFLRMKDGSIRMPKFTEWQHLSEDFLNLFADYNTQNVLFYNKMPGKPDDLVHALNFCYLAALIDTGQLNVVKTKLA